MEVGNNACLDIWTEHLLCLVLVTKIQVSFLGMLNKSLKYCDNRTAMLLTPNPCFTKHVY